MKSVLVTGGNSGIGYSIAKLCKEEGYQVTITGRDTEKVKAAAKELGVDSFVANLASVTDLKALASTFLDEGLDALINNAAMARFMPLEMITEGEYTEFFEVNVRGPMALCQYLLPALEKKRGCITNISSAIVNNGLPNASLYAATKGAIESFSRSLAVELAPRGIRVNVVSPGAVNTPLLSKLGVPDEQIRAIREHQESNVIPLARYGDPDEIAHVVVSQIEAGYVTGSIWRVDGGVDAQ